MISRAATDVDDGPLAGRTVIVVSGPCGVGKTTVAHHVAATADRSVHLEADDLTASIVRGFIRPDLAEAAEQNEAIGGALAVSAMSLAHDGYTTVVSGSLFPDGVASQAAACRARSLGCHYAVLMADVDRCWQRAADRARPAGVSTQRWPLERAPVAALHERFTHLELDRRFLIDATQPRQNVCDAMLAALLAGDLAVDR